MLWASAVIRKDKNDDNKITFQLPFIHEGNNAIKFGYQGKKDTTDRYWSLDVFGEHVSTDVPITFDKPTLMVLKIEFGDHGTDPSGIPTKTSVFVDPIFLGDNIPAQPNLQINTFDNAKLFEAKVQMDQDAGAVDEIRLGATYESVVPTPEDTEAPEAPTNLSAANRTISSVDLVWDAATDNVGVVAYNVYRNSTLLGTIGETTYSVKHVDNDSEHIFYVTALDPMKNESDSSDGLTVGIVKTTPPTIPTGIQGS